jgi:hypothetical protein
MAGVSPADSNRSGDEEEAKVKATWLMIAMCCLLLSSNALAQNSTVDKTRERAEKAKPSDCAKVCFEAAKQLIEASNQLYEGGDAVGGLKLMNDAVAYAKRGTEASIESRKNEKNAEISLRKMAKRMHEIGQSLALEDRAPVFANEKALDDMRDQMLAALFGTPKTSLEEKK